MDRFQIVALLLVICISIACIYPHSWDSHDTERAIQHSNKRFFHESFERSKEVVKLENEILSLWMFIIALVLWLVYFIAF